MNASFRMQRIEAIQIQFEVEPGGYAVDSITLQGTPPPNKTLRERAIVTIKLLGDMAEYRVSEPYASQIYDAAEKYLDEQSA